MSRGWFAVGIENGKTESNIGTLWRTAHSLGAAYIFTIGHRYYKQPSDTTRAWRSVPLMAFDTLDDMLSARPRDALLIGVENSPSARKLWNYGHPERAVYLLGAEDIGLSARALAACNSVVVIPGAYCLNVASAGAIVLAHRVMQREEPCPKN